METLEEATANHESSHIIIKGKRTKRQRVLLLDPPPAATTSSTSSAEISGSTTEEEEDMANCLILLARGRAREPEPKRPIEEASGGVITEKFTSRRLAETPTTTNGKAGFYVYECKTCNKCFPSFQALGGHRASHKKPKMVMPISMLMAQERKEMDGEDALQISLNSLSKPILSPGNNTSSSKPKVHECSICRAEFSSGQALGGHMRRHRSLSLAEAPDAKKERNMLALDLNLPAPSDEDRSEFPRSPSYVAKPQLLFSASALVDCHF